MKCTSQAVSTHCIELYVLDPLVLEFVLFHMWQEGQLFIECSEATCM